MNDEDKQEEKIAAQIKAYFEKANSKSNDNIDLTRSDEVTDPGILRLLGKMRLHDQALVYIKSETIKYQNKLYSSAKLVAENEGEDFIITKAHAQRAKEVMSSKKNKYDLSDLFLGLGGLFLGALVPHMFDLLDDKPPPLKFELLVFGIIGAFLFGIGVIEKAKK